ncbi:hypothetical protein R6L23_26505 [Streptomyces sp. SR27]|uniref:hypothetical protein n=1 Tax=Streptomyces sp. SR27 TaxID=3076630 RepID=UPI00295C1902|nr:hypothetical protein [Streptomyces sp. SR27]MDV9191718.1 hypothetical protein [Streptomyces sp. SR27]
MSAKVLIVAVVQTLFGALAAAASFWLSQAVLSVRDAGLSITHPGALRLVVASALLAPVCAVTGMALGAQLRRSAVSVVGSVLLLLFVPMVLGERRHLTAVLAHTTPLKAWQRLAAPGTFEQPYPWTVGGRVAGVRAVGGRRGGGDGAGGAAPGPVRSATRRPGRSRRAAAR